jgi:hypothetical protein
VSETHTRESVRQAVLISVFRLAYVQRQALPKTLRQMMAQEGRVGAFAGLKPIYDEEELEYSRFVLAPHLDTADYSICIAAFYGDEAARSLGYQPLGLSKDAGFAVALADALAESASL